MCPPHFVPQFRCSCGFNQQVSSDKLCQAVSMEDVLKRIGADAMLVSDENGQVLHAKTPQSKEDLREDAAGMLYLDKLSTSLKMGTIKQAVVVDEDGAIVGGHNNGTYSVVSAPTLAQALLADSVVNEAIIKN